MSLAPKSRLEGMSFILGKGRAIAITADVFALEENPHFAFIPGSKHFFQGFFKYAGRMVPCFDLQIFCGLPAGEGSVGKCLISRTSSGDLAAVWVQDIMGVRNINTAEHQGRSPDLPKPLAPYVLNSCVIEEQSHLLIDLQKLVTDLTSDSATLY